MSNNWDFKIDLNKIIEKDNKELYKVKKINNLLNFK
jgi:hypothetical protein